MNSILGKVQIPLFFLTGSFLLTTTLSSPAQEVTLEFLTSRYEKECGILAKPFGEFQGNYEKNLQRLLNRVTKAGELEKLVAVRAEIAGFREGDTPDVGPEFPELNRLQKIYLKSGAKQLAAMEAKAVPLTKDYKKHLEGLKKRLTQQSRVEEALAVNQVIADLANQKTVFTVVGPSSPEPKKPTGQSSLATDLRGATQETPFINHLGMQFVPVPITGGPTEGKRVLFSVWETRVADYEEFIKDERNREWPKPDFPQNGDHPAVNLTWGDATDFCEWLTKKEQRKRLLGRNDRYRLPTDHEWSCAAGIGKFEDPTKTPYDKRATNLRVYPWGTEWPPPKGAGNYQGEETKTNPPPGDSNVLTGFNDGFDRTSPVGTFSKESNGISDLSGNVKEWCEDRYFEGTGGQRGLRGGSWESEKEVFLRSSARNNSAPNRRNTYSGFRVVCEVDSVD